MTRVTGRFGHSADSLEQLLPADFPRLIGRLAFRQLCDGRSASQRGNAAFGAKTNVRDAIPFQFESEFEHVTADGVLHLHDGVWRLDFSGVSWILKMVEQLCRIHKLIVMRPPRGFPPLQ